MVTSNRLFALLCLLCASTVLFGQGGDRKDKTAVTYEELYDEPYSVNRLFVQLQPLYGEMFTANVNAGFGLEAQYYLKDKANFKAHFRKTYSSSFFDFNREQAKQNSDVDNDQTKFYYFEFGGTYHVKDFESPSKTKMVLYKKSYSGNKWASRVPLDAEVPCKVRKIIGARLGSIIWQSSFDVNNVMKKQDLKYDDFKDSEGNAIPSVDASGDELKMFSNIKSAGLYLGGSMTWIRNVAVSFDKFEAGVDDLILTTYFDLIFSPSVRLDDIVYTDRTVDPMVTNTYMISPVGVKKIGARLGIEGKFNRTLSWAYGGEIGWRPGIEGRMFYALVKISFPVFGTNLDYKVESFGK